MIDPELIQMCADPRLEVEIVQQFVAEMNAADHLTLNIWEEGRAILVSKPETIDQAVLTTQDWLGKADVRVGLTQYPAGYGISEANQVAHDLFDTCANLSLGTTLFGKVLRVVSERLDGPAGTLFEETITAYRSGWFEGEQVFYAVDPMDAFASPERSSAQVERGAGETSQVEAEAVISEPPVSDLDPNAASMRIDLSGIGAHNNESPSAQ